MAHRDRAIYMRAYRQRRRTDLLAGEARIGELEAEVRRLTAALGKGPTIEPTTSFNSRAFSPAPKAGR